MMKKRGKGAVARIILSAMLLVSMMASVVPTASAASLSSMSLTLSSSQPDAEGVTHTFAFTTATAGTIRGLEFEYCTTGSGSCTTPLGLSTTGASIDGAATSPNDFDGFNINFSTNGLMAMTDTTGFSYGGDTALTIALAGITNLSEDSGPTTFYVRITTYSDTGLGSVIDGPSQIVSAVIPVITVSGTQDAILELIVSSVSASTTVGDSSETKTTTAASTATTLPFGNFLPLSTAGEESKAVAHIINIKTNGTSGYSASVQGGASAMTRSGGSETIGYVSADHDWDESASVGFGVNAQDVAGGDNEANEPVFGTVAGNLDYEPISSAVILASSGVPTAGVDTMVVYRVQVNVIQAAGNYTGSINYTVLPNF
ncbi:MAG: hypothetical protein IIB33_00665 [Chloroflexi bacterium]|nr:hypothetical protein [Chloroflexota bacterium]